MKLISQLTKDIELRDWKPPAWVKEFYIHVHTVVYRQLCKEYRIIPHPPRTVIGKARISGMKHYDTTDEFVSDFHKYLPEFDGVWKSVYVNPFT